MKKLHKPDKAEDLKINEAVTRDPDAFIATSAQLAKARRGRPKLEKPKQAISIRLDADVVEHFKSTGKGWQSWINEVLKQSVEPVNSGRSSDYAARARGLRRKVRNL